MELKTFLLTILTIINNTSTSNLLYSSDGDLNLGILVQECGSESAHKRTIINSAVWTVNRLNNIHHITNLDIGLRVFKVCSSDDYYNSIFSLYRNRHEKFLLGLITLEPLPENVQEFVNVLDVRFKSTSNFLMPLIKASVNSLMALNWLDDLTVFAPNQDVLREFYRMTRREWICVKDFHIYSQHTNTENIDFNTKNSVVLFGDVHTISSFFDHYNSSSSPDENSILVIPLDGSEVNSAPDGSYIIQPLFSDVSDTPRKPQKILPSPLLFEIANPILSYTQNVTNFVNEFCNETIYKLNCIKANYKIGINYEILNPETVLKILKIEILSDEFIYNVLKVDNISAIRQENNISAEFLKTLGELNYEKVFAFNMVDSNLTVVENVTEKTNSTKTGCVDNFEHCILECVNFKTFELVKFFNLHEYTGLHLRVEPWVFAFISVSTLGVMFSIAILIFIITRLCKRNVLEGNPILTILLLICVVCMFASVIPFSIENVKGNNYGIYLGRSLSITLPYTVAFALLLSRTILLATVSKEVGFMSHVAGAVQAFMTFFIIAVQGALSIQLNENCRDVFRGISMVYLQSYNALLLVLLVFITPLVARSKRNYKEGKYFTITVVLLALSWSCWLPGYAVLDENWKDPLLCLGMVSSASILLGSIFIPRTYLMTVAAARERFNSGFPSLATATSAMDIYRASTQPVYDCVNVAAVNANLSRASTAPLPPPQRSRPHPDYYASPDAAEDDDDFEVTQCDTPPPDKVTRF